MRKRQVKCLHSLYLSVCSIIIWFLILWRWPVPFFQYHYELTDLNKFGEFHLLQLLLCSKLKLSCLGPVGTLANWLLCPSDTTLVYIKPICDGSCATTYVKMSLTSFVFSLLTCGRSFLHPALTLSGKWHFMTTVWTPGVPAAENWPLFPDLFNGHCYSI